MKIITCSSSVKYLVFWRHVCYLNTWISISKHGRYMRILLNNLSGCSLSNSNMYWCPVLTNVCIGIWSIRFKYYWPSWSAIIPNITSTKHSNVSSHSLGDRDAHILYLISCGTKLINTICKNVIALQILVKTTKIVLPEYCQSSMAIRFVAFCEIM